MSIRDMFSSIQTTGEMQQTIEELEIDLIRFEILKVMQEVFDYHFKDRKFSDVSMDSPLIKVAEGDLPRFSTVMVDTHMALNLEIHYMVLEEFEMFDNIADCINYFTYLIVKGMDENGRSTSDF